MFIKNLTISAPSGVIRSINFFSGLNLIVDNTPTTDTQLTGNNVGKTTLLKLVDFCLGAKPHIIYTDTENKKAVYDTVKNFLVDNEVSIELVLVDDLNDLNSRSVVVKRNFFEKSKAIRNINNEPILDKDFENELLRSIIPHQNNDKPTFRQIISHNIRYKDDSINNTLKTLDGYTTDVEYEALYLFLLGCTFADGEKKREIHAKITQETDYKARLEQKQTRNAYEIALAMIEDDIEVLNRKKETFNLNETFEADLEQLNYVKYQINKASSTLGKMNIRKNLIEEAKREMENNISKIDISQLEMLYKEVTLNISGIQKTFDDLVSYHNSMVVEKIKFITAELPDLSKKIENEENSIKFLLEQERELADKISKGDSFEALESVIGELNEKYRTKGEYETIISQIAEVDSNLSKLKKDMSYIDEFLFSSEFEESLKTQIIKFNKYFSAISNELYGEKYALKYEKITNKRNQQIYKFSTFNAFNPNMSSGKKQGEILCFDLAYILFADEENLPCLHFLLNDKKELMHDNQLNKVSEFVKARNVQLIVSILRDKLPDELINNAHIVIELSQDDKLFKIEKQGCVLSRN